METQTPTARRCAFVHSTPQRLPPPFRQPHCECTPSTPPPKTTSYKELVALYDKYSKDGLEVLAFPSNQFGRQEPGTPAQIRE